MAYAADVTRVLQCYRRLFDPAGSINDKDILSNFSFADEFMSHQLEIRTMKIIMAVQGTNGPGVGEAFTVLADMLFEEKEYKTSKGYSHAIIGDKDNNRRLLHRHSLLKKYIESALFLKANTTQDGQAVKQISFSLAAGLAMMVYLLITMPFQKYLGNYPASFSSSLSSSTSSRTASRS